MRLVNKGLRSKEIIMLDGVVSIRRTILVPEDEESARKLLELDGINCIYPLDAIIGIERIPFKATYKALAAIAKEGIRSKSYREAAQRLKEHHHYNISSSQVKRVVDHVCNLVYSNDCQQAESASSFKGKVIDRRKCKKDVAYLEFDGSYYLENISEGIGCEWKECKIAIAFKKSDIRVWGNNTTEIKKRDFVGYIGASDDFKNHILALAVRNGFFNTKEMVVITDGAPWILPVIKELFPHAVPILDLFHAKENAGKFAYIVKRGKNQKKEFADELCRLIEEGNIDELIRVLSPYKDFKKAGIVNLYKYVDRLKECMHYDEYRSKGYLLGSGHIESAHRYVMQNRMKGPGQHWNKENGQGVLSGKCRYESDNWDSVVQLIYEDYERCRNKL